jgi:AbiV family abortive infection protein
VPNDDKLTGEDFKQLAEQRLEDAELLFANCRYPAAYYLAGYAIECALKACICKTIREEAWPTGELKKTYFVHKLGNLLKLSGQEKDFYTAQDSDQALADNWKTISDWAEDKRYNALTTKEMAEALITAVKDQVSGVLPWIKQRW